MGVRIPLGPVDAEGVRSDRPPSQVRWTELTNLVINEGRLESRPGFGVPSNGGALDVPAVQPSPILSLVEILNPGSSATGRESYTPGAEVLVPDGNSAVVAGWAGAATDIDEGVPDAAAVMSTSTVGAAENVTFSNPATATYTAIMGVVFHVRARISNQGAWAKLNFYYGSSTTASQLFHSRIVTTREEAESDDWEDFYFTLSRDLLNSKPLSNVDLSGLSITMELDSAEAIQAETVLATGNGAHSGWVDAQDGGTAVFGDCNGKTHIMVFDSSTLPSNRWIRSAGDGTKQSFTFSPTLTFASITNLELSSYVRKPGGRQRDASVQLTFWDSGAVEHEFADVPIHAGQPGRIARAGLQTNPETSAAWTVADITGGEFGIKHNSGAQVALGTFSMHIMGTRTGGVGLQVDVVNAQVLGVTTSNPGSGLMDKTRLFSSNLWHNRMDDDRQNPTVTDVTNSVPLDSTGPGWPVNHTVLYGQAFLVNGVDPTVFYPDGSNTFSELATNNADGATALTGRTVAAFGDRLMYGWVKDNATVTPERISYSKWRDASTHNHRSAGDFDLIDTPGGVIAMVPLDEQLMAVIKEVGAYVIRRTGNDIFPFIRDVVHFDVGVIGARTAQAVAFNEKNAVMFLGRTSTFGINVYMFDGTTVQPVGREIARELREDMNHASALITAHAMVDPQTNTYWLFIPEGLDSYCKQAWVMNLTTKQWTRAEFPWTVFSSGIWHYPDLDWLANDSSINTIGGQPKLTLGTGSNYLPMAANVDVGYDEMSHASTDVTSTLEDYYDWTTQGLRHEAFVAKMTTGDLVKPGDRESVSYKVGVIYKALDPINRVLIDVSEDGGQNYKSSLEYWFGPQDDDNNDVRAPVGGVYYAEWDLIPSHAAQVRYRFRFQPEAVTIDGTVELSTNANEVPQRIEIHDMWLTMEDGADSE